MTAFSRWALGPVSGLKCLACGVLLRAGLSVSVETLQHLEPTNPLNDLLEWYVALSRKTATFLSTNNIKSTIERA